MAAAGYQAEESWQETREVQGTLHPGGRGQSPLDNDGMYCFPGGAPFVEKLKAMAADATAVIAWGSCASEAASRRPSPTRPARADRQGDLAKADHQGAGLSADRRGDDRRHELHPHLRPAARTRPPGPAQDVLRPAHPRQMLSPAAFRRRSIRRAWDDEGARKGYCLYKMGCKGPTTYNACSTVRWNDGVSFPIQSGHGCIGCSEKGFWDTGRSTRLTDISQFGIERERRPDRRRAPSCVGRGGGGTCRGQRRQAARRQERTNANDQSARGGKS